MRTVQRWIDATPRRAGSGVGKYNAERPKQGSKRLNCQVRRNTFHICVWLVFDQNHNRILKPFLGLPPGSRRASPVGCSSPPLTTGAPTGWRLHYPEVSVYTVQCDSTLSFSFHWLGHRQVSVCSILYISTKSPLFREDACILPVYLYL